MNLNLQQLQGWLNGKGAALVADGVAGPKTRAAIIETFRNTQAPAISPAELATIAKRLDCTRAQIAAVAAVEGGGAGWDNSGLLKCLWERHYLWRRVRVIVPFLSNPKPGGYTVDADRDGINDSWERLADAALLWPVAAFECASFGKFQIMGAHWKALGYPSAWEFVWTLSRTEYAHYDALRRFIMVNNLQAALRRINESSESCRTFARGYNGGGYERGGYHIKIAKAYAREAER